MSEIEDINIPAWRLLVLRWCFLLVGIVAVYLGEVVAIWMAWLGVLIVALLPAKRYGLFLLAQIALAAICVGAYLVTDRYVALKYYSMHLPYTDNWMAIVPVAGIIVQVVFAMFVVLGQYNYRHNTMGEYSQLSRTYVENEFRRHERD